MENWRHYLGRNERSRSNFRVCRETRAAARSAHLSAGAFLRALRAVSAGVPEGHEADSPRGRIQLMRGLADGVIQPTESVRRHLDLCLDCRGCETACPSGVVYHELIEETRARLAETTKLTAQGRLMRWIFFHV